MNSDYNPTGINTPQNLGSQSPVSNPGVVYEPANNPTSAGALKTGQQTVKSLIFRSTTSQNQIRILLDQGYNPNQNPGTIFIIDDKHRVIFAAGIVNEVFVSALTAQDFTGNTGFYVSRDSTAPSTTNDVAIIQDNDTSSTGKTLLVDNKGLGLTVQLQQENTGNTQPVFSIIQKSTVLAPFQYIEIFSAGATAVSIVTSDGTNPNGLLTANKGSISLNSSAKGQIAYNTDGSTGWALAGAGGSGNVSNVYAGSVVSNAAAAYFPTGWSFSRTGAGIYTITHNLGTTNYSVNITPIGIVADFAAAYTKTTTQFSVVIANSSTVPVDSNFDFIVTS
jgi:hypothetical protein